MMSWRECGQYETCLAKKNHILYVKFAIKMLIYHLNQDSQLVSVQNTSSLHHYCALTVNYMSCIKFKTLECFSYFYMWCLAASDNKIVRSSLFTSSYPHLTGHQRAETVRQQDHRVQLRRQHLGVHEAEGGQELPQLLRHSHGWAFPLFSQCSPLISFSFFFPSNLETSAEPTCLHIPLRLADILKFSSYKSLSKELMEENKEYAWQRTRKNNLPYSSYKCILCVALI